MGLGEPVVTEGERGGGGAIDADSLCSICFEAVMAGGERSTVKLLCLHEFHLDCIGSAFNAKGTMQCPNCRNVEKGNWIHGNGNSLLPSVSIDEWTHDDELYETHDDELYELNFCEIPYTIRWCPVNRIGRVASSFGNADSYPSAAFEDFVGPNVITELPSISVPSHPCPHLSGFHQVQPASAPTFHASSGIVTDTSLYYPQWSQVSDSAEFPTPPSLHTSDAHYHGWDRNQSTYSHPRYIVTASNQAPISHAAPPRGTMLEDDGPPGGAGSLYYCFNGRHGTYDLPERPHPYSSNRTPAHNQELHRQTNISSEQWVSQNSNAGHSIWPPSNHMAVYTYPFPPSFNISIGDMTNTGAQLLRSGAQLAPMMVRDRSMESGGRTFPHRRNSSSERQIALARLEDSLHGSNTVRSPYF